MISILLVKGGLRSQRENRYFCRRLFIYFLWGFTVENGIVVLKDCGDCLARNVVIEYQAYRLKIIANYRKNFKT